MRRSVLPGAREACPLFYNLFEDRALGKTDVNYIRHFPGSRVTTTGVGNSVTGVTVDETPSAAFEARTRISTNTPNFRAVHREDLPMNPFTFGLTVHKWSDGYTYQKHIATDNWVERSGWLGIGYVNLEPREVTDSVRSRLKTSALGKAQGKIKDQHLSLGVTFGELKETSKMLFDTARKTTDAIGALRAGEFGLAGNILFRDALFDQHGRVITRGGATQFYDRNGNRIGRIKTRGASLADLFAQFQWGWGPLYKDLYDSFEHLARLISDRGFDVRTSASSTHRFNVSTTEMFEGLPITRREFGNATSKYTFVYRQGYPDAVLHLKQVGLTNPLATLYQLKSLSFVADWFLPMGRYLDLLDYDLGLQLVKACRTDFEKTTVRYDVRTAGIASGYENYARWKASKVVVSCVRTPITAFPSVPLPRINPNPLGPDRGLSALALLKQRLSPLRG